MHSFQIVEAGSSPVPILLSVPHCGTAFPLELQEEYNSDLIRQPDDTDWFVHELYDFATAIGITIIHATYSRWVIDLNRDPNSKPLYTDGRIITALCPTTDFLGKKLYNDRRDAVADEEVRRRVSLYYEPYHNEVQALLNDLKSRFGKVLLWDCHSIRQYVPTINKDPFPDLILGDVDGASASHELIDDTLAVLKSSPYSVHHNHPFKGGYITRHFGKPMENQHALQLEMTKVNYMNDAELAYDKTRADKMRAVLQQVFEKLIDRLK